MVINPLLPVVSGSNHHLHYWFAVQANGPTWCSISNKRQGEDTGQVHIIFFFVIVDLRTAHRA